MPDHHAPSTKWLVTPVGQSHVFDGWRQGPFADWQVVDPDVADLDPTHVVTSFWDHLVATVTDRHVWLVGVGDAAHLCVSLLGRAREGRCVLIDPPVAQLLPVAEQETYRDEGLTRAAGIDGLQGPLEEVARAQDLGLSEDERLLVLISALEDSDLPGDEASRAEIKRMLEASRRSLEKGSGKPTRILAPWWDTVFGLRPAHEVTAWFSQSRRLPTSLPVDTTVMASWPTDWWRSSTTEVAAATAEFLSGRTDRTSAS